MDITLRYSCACAVVVLSILPNLGCAGGDAREARAFDIVDPAPPPLMMSARAPVSGDASVGVATPVRAAAPRVTLLTLAKPAARDLRVMSFNVRRSIFIDALNHWSFRKELLVATILNFKP